VDREAAAALLARILLAVRSTHALKLG